MKKPKSFRALAIVQRDQLVDVLTRAETREKAIKQINRAAGERVVDVIVREQAKPKKARRIARRA